MKLAAPLLSILLAMTAFGCDEDEAVADMPAPVLRVEADVTEVMPGDTITLTIEVDNFTLSGEDHDHDHGDDHEHLERGFEPGLASPSGPAAAEEGHEDHDHDHGDDAAYDGPREGHVHVYLDDTMVDPLAMLTTATGEVVIDAEPGTHTLINRLHGADHKIIEPQIIEEIEITVLAP
ncbi:MAG: hypothetical protein AB1Z98_04870 [Nannocystaceae bacterium]